MTFTATPGLAGSPRPPMDAWGMVRAVKRHWVVVVVATLVGVVIGVGTTLLPSKEAAPEPSAYSATTTLILDFSSLSDQTDPVLRNLDQAAVLTTSGDVPDRVAEELGGDGAILAEQISTLTDSDAATLAITAVDRDPDRAVMLANSFADNLIAALHDKAVANADAERQRVIDQVKELTARRDALDQQIATPGVAPDDLEILKAQRDAVVNQFRLAYTRLETLAADTSDPNILTSIGSPKAVVISGAEYRAALDRGRSGANHARTDPNGEAPVATVSSGTPLDGTAARGIAGALAGFVLGLGIVFVRERLNPVARTRSDVEDVLGCHVLAEVPPLSKWQQADRSVLVHDAPRSPTAEAYRGVRSSLLFLRDVAQHDASPTPDDEPRSGFVVMVVSGEPREGKTVSSANLAAAFAETGMTVAAVDCDFRCPNLSRYLQVADPGHGGERAAKVPGVTFVPTAPKDRRAHPAEVIARQRHIIEYLRTRADVIVLDVAPLLITNDAAELFSLADIAVIVVRAGQTRIHSAERARDLLARHTVPVAGAVVVAADVAAMAYYDYYVNGREAYVSQSPEFSPRAAPVPAAPRDVADSRRAAPTKVETATVPAPPRVMSVKELLEASSGSPNGWNGNRTNGNGRSPHA